MTLSLRLKILLVTAGSAVALVGVLIWAIRSAYTTAIDTRLQSAIGRLQGVLGTEIEHEMDTIDVDAQAIAREVRFRNLLIAAADARGAARRKILSSLPELVRNQDAARKLGGDRLSWFLFFPDPADPEGPERVRCVYTVARDRLQERFTSLPVAETDAPEDGYVAARFREFDAAVRRDPKILDEPERFEPALLLMATTDEIYVASYPAEVFDPTTEEIAGYLVVSRPLRRTKAVKALQAAVGDPIFFDLLHRTVAETLAGDDATPQTRTAFAAAIRAAVTRGPHDARVGGRLRRFVASPIPVAGAATTAHGVIAFDLDRELEPMHAAEAMVWRASLAVLAGIVVVSLLLSGAIARPIRRLSDATDQIAGGDLAVEVPARGRDEIGRLARHFNHMAEGLRERERMRGLLDKVVSEEVAGELMQLQRDGKLHLGGEVREVTVLFCDLRNFTATTEKMTPDEVIEMLNEYLTAVVAPIDAEQGVVDKFVGDEVMAIFGAPLQQADSAARALRAAQGMQRAMDALNATRTARGAAPLACGIGVNTGPAVAGLTGSKHRLSYTVLGATVNLAARLCSAAKPGQILVAQGTKADAGDIPVTALEPIAVKGFSQPVPIYAVGADVKDTRRLERADAPQGGVDPGAQA